MSTPQSAALLTAMAGLATIGGWFGAEQDTGAKASASDRGNVSFALSVEGGARVSEARYTITRRGLPPVSGSIQLASGAPSALSIALPASRDYTLTLRARASDGSACGGSASFDVLGGRSEEIALPVRCVAAAG